MKILKKTLCVILSVIMLCSALSVSFTAFAAEDKMNEAYRELAYSFFKYTIKSVGFTSSFVVNTDENGFPLTTILGDMDHYDLSNASSDYVYADADENPIRSISYDHKVTAKDDSAGTIREAFITYLEIVDNIISYEYGVGFYTLPMVAEEIADTLMFTKGDDGEYLFLDGYTYVENAVGEIIGRSPEKTYKVVDGEIKELKVDEDWKKAYGDSVNYITIYEYCNVPTILSYFNGNCTSVNSSSWFHTYSFSCYTDVDAVLTTETLVNQVLTLKYYTVEWTNCRQYDDSGLEPQYYNGGYTVTENRTSTDNIRRDLVAMQSALVKFFQKFYADGFLKNVKNYAENDPDLIDTYYQEIRGEDNYYYNLFQSLSNKAMLAVFGQSAYSYMHLVNQLTPIANPKDPHDATYWPKHTYEKYYDEETGGPEVYQVDSKKVTSLVSTIDSILTNEKLGGIVKSFLTLSDPIKAQNAKTPQDVLKLFIEDMVYQDSIINMLLELLYPMVSELIDGLITDEFIESTLDDLSSGLSGFVEFIVNEGAGWQATIYAAIASIGVTLTPAGMAYVWHKFGYLEDSYGYTTAFGYTEDGQSQFLANYEHLYKAKGGINKSGNIQTSHGGINYDAIGSEDGENGYCGQRWKDVDFSKIVWNINGDKNKFLLALDAILAPLAPLLAVLLGESDSTITVTEIMGSKAYLLLNDDTITHDYYDRLLLPLFQVLGINKADHGLLTGTEFNTAADAIRSEGSRRPNTISKFLNDGILNPLLNWVTETVLADPITTVMTLLPNLSYALTSGVLINAIGTISIPIRLKYIGIEFTVYTLNLMELLGEDTLAFLDSVQGIIELIGLKVDTGIPVVGYHAEGEGAVYKPGMTGYDENVHTIPTAEAYMSSIGEMNLYQDSWHTTKVVGIDENGELTDYAVRHNIGWKNWKGEVVTERDEEQMIAFNTEVDQYYEYTDIVEDEDGNEVEKTFKVAEKSMIPEEILESGNYSHVRDVETIKESAALPPIMDYKLQATGTLVTETNCGRYNTLTASDGSTWGSGVRKYIKMEMKDSSGTAMRTEGLVFVFLLRYVFTALMYRPFSGSEFTSDYTLLDVFGLDNDTLNGDIIAGLKIKDIIDNIALHPDEALAALLELFYKNEFGSLFKIVDGKVVAGDDYAYELFEIDYHADEILAAAAEHNDYSYGTAVLYTEKWTKEQSEYLINNLDDIVEDVFAMLKMDGADSLGGLLEDLLGGMLFTNDMIGDLAAMLYGLLGSLGGSIDILAILDAALGVNISKKALADALVYEFGDAVKTDGSYVDEDGNTVVVESVYNQLMDDVNLAAQYQRQAEDALRVNNLELYDELLAMSKEALNFSDSTFFKTGVVEVEDEETDEETDEELDEAATVAEEGEEENGEETDEPEYETVNLYAYDWGYYNSQIKSTYTDAEIFLKAASAVLSPFSILIKFIFMGEDLTLIKETEDAEVGLINIPGYEVYHYAWIPLMETLGATKGLVSFRTYYEMVYSPAVRTGDNALPAGIALETAQNCDAIYYLFSPIIGLVESVFENPIEVVFNLIPNLLFFLSVGGLNGLVNNIAHFAYVLLDILTPIVDAYPVINSLLSNIRIGDMALNLSLPLDVDVNQIVNQLLESVLGESLAFDIENKNIVLGTQEVEKEVFVPTLDDFGNEQLDKDGNVIGEMEMQTVTEDIYAVGTLKIKLPFIDLTTLCSGTLSERRSVSGNSYLYLDTGNGADLITTIFRLVTDTLFFEDNAENIANFLIGFAQLDDEDDNDDLVMEIFMYLNEEANKTDIPDLIPNLLFYIIKFLLPVADELGLRFKRVDFSITDMFSDTDNIMDYISALLDAGGGPPNETLTGFKKLIQLIKEFFAKLAAAFKALFGG